MQVVVDDQVVHYEKTGNGPAVVLVHGWGDSLSTFYDLQSSLSKKFTVVSIDLPGFGQSHTLNKPWDLKTYAEFLADFVKKLELKVNVFIGHSNGGAILIYGLSNKILRANKLVLLASSGIRNKQQIKKHIIKVAAKSGKVVTSVLPKKTKLSLRTKFYGVIGSEMLLVPNMEETFKNIVNQDIRNDAKELRLPTLLIYGKEDQATPPSFGELFNKLIDSSKLVAVDHAGHFVHHDQPLQVEKFIKEFI